MDKSKLLIFLNERLEKAEKGYEVAESNCQCSGNGNDYANYGAELSEAEGRKEEVEKIIHIIERGDLD